MHFNITIGIGQFSVGILKAFFNEYQQFPSNFFSVVQALLVT